MTVPEGRQMFFFRPQSKKMGGNGAVRWCDANDVFAGFEIEVRQSPENAYFQFAEERAFHSLAPFSSGAPIPLRARWSRPFVCSAAPWGSFRGKFWKTQSTELQERVLPSRLVLPKARGPWPFETDSSPPAPPPRPPCGCAAASQRPGLLFPEQRTFPWFERNSSLPFRFD